MRSSHGQPCWCICSTSDWSEPSPGCGPIASCFVLGAEDAEQAAQLDERVAPARLDRAEDADHALRVVDEMRARLRLHDDDADAVRDHVVELARDPPALLGDCQLRLLLALALQPRRAVLEVGDSLASSP